MGELEFRKADIVVYEVGCFVREFLGEDMFINDIVGGSDLGK